MLSVEGEAAVLPSTFLSRRSSGRRRKVECVFCFIPSRTTNRRSDGDAILLLQLRDQEPSLLPHSALDRLRKPQTSRPRPSVPLPALPRSPGLSTPPAHPLTAIRTRRHPREPATSRFPIIRTIATRSSGPLPRRPDHLQSSRIALCRTVSLSHSELRN